MRLGNTSLWKGTAAVRERHLSHAAATGTSQQGHACAIKHEQCHPHQEKGHKWLGQFGSLTPSLPSNSPAETQHSRKEEETWCFPGALWQTVLERLQSSYPLHMHCSVAEICLLWSPGCRHLLLIHCLREALKREGKLGGEAPVMDSAGMVMAVTLRGMARVSSCLLNKCGGKSGEFKSVSSCRAGFLREAAASELPCPSDIVGSGLSGSSSRAQCLECPACGQDSTAEWPRRNSGPWDSTFPCKWAMPWQRSPWHCQ